MSRARRGPLFGAAAWSAVTLGSALGAGAQVAPTSTTELLVVPEPALERVEPAIRSQLEEVRASLDALLAQGETADPPRLAEAFGHAGKLYFLYDLDAAAEAAFTNARALAPEDSRWIYYLGALLQENGRFGAARDELQRVLAKHPDDVATLLRLGEVQLALEEIEDAAALYRRARELAPDLAAARFGLGQALFALGRLEDAAGHLEAILETHPDASRVHYQLGLVYRDLGRREEARAHLQPRPPSLLPLPDPLVEDLDHLASGAGVFIERANRAAGEGDFERALVLYRRALAGDPESFDARHSAAAMLAELGRREEARREFEVLVERAPDDPLVHSNLGSVRAQTGDLEGAAESFLRAVELGPELIDPRRALAAVLEQLGRMEASERHYARLLELAPEDTEARSRYARVLAELGRPDAAVAELRKVVADDAGNSLAQFTLATVYETTGQPRLAADAYRRAIAAEEQPASRAMAHFRLGLVLAAQADDESLEHLSSAVELRPDLLPARRALAESLGRRGRFAEAADQFLALVELRPTDADLRFAAALALIFAGRDADARRHLEASFAAFPSHIGLEHALARLLATADEAAARDGEQALELARGIFDRQPSYDHAETLAMAYAELGRFDEAVRWQKQLIERARASGRGDLLPGLGRRLAAYEAGEPTRSPWRESWR